MSEIEKNRGFPYNLYMKKFIVLVLLLVCNVCYASEELSKQAVAFYCDNNYDKTMEMLLQIDEKERTAQDWLLLGNLFDEKGDKENAIYMYQKAISTDKKFYKAYYNLGNLYLADSKNNLAIQNYKLATRYYKDNPYVYYNLGCAYLKQGQAKQAKAAFIKAVTLKADVAEFHYNLAYTFNLLGNKKNAQTYLNNYNKLKESNTQ